MSDQAENLRRKLQQQDSLTEAKVISFLSTGGERGRTDIAADFAAELRSAGPDVLLLGKDEGKAVSSLVLGGAGGTGKEQQERARLFAAPGRHPEGLRKTEAAVFPSSVQGFERLLFQYDYIILDIEAGAPQEEVRVAACSDEVFIIMENGEASLKEAYSMIKRLYFCSPQQHISLLLNRAGDERKDKKTLKRVRKVTADFLDKELDLPGLPSKGEPFPPGYPLSVISSIINEGKEEGSSSSFLLKLKKVVTET